MKVDTREALKDGLKIGLGVFIAGMLLLPASGFAQPEGKGCRGGKAFIERFDTDGDGKLSQEEFPSPEKFMSKMDVNGDGYIDASEASSLPGRHGKGKGNLIKRLDEDGDGRISMAELPTPEKRFAKMDTNGDGFIDATEASSAPGRHGKRMSHFIERFDEDGDGKVSMEEFPSPEKRFARMDANGDGFIEASELPKWHHRQGPPPEDE